MTKQIDIDELLTRSIAEILPGREALKKILESGKKLKIYIGTDATGPALHLGHATNYIFLEKMRKLGHEVIFLIGDFTARIGDPSDKMALRKMLTSEDIQKNIATWLNQLEPIVGLHDKENPPKILYNSEWLAKLTFEDVVNLASNFTVQQMLERDMFEKRIKEGKPVFLHEFMYPLMQGYDSVAMDIDIELCGTDQTFNALAGRTLLKKLKNKEKFVITTTLLENPITHEKMMSKSLGTGIYLNDEPNNMFGKVMMQADENIYQLFVDCTYLSMSEINNIKKIMDQGGNPRDAKLRLAQEIVAIYHGQDAGTKAKSYFEQTFQKKELDPDTFPELIVKDGTEIADLLVGQCGIESKGEAKRLITQNAVRIGDNTITVPNYIVGQENQSAGQVLQVGKKKFFKIVL